MPIDMTLTVSITTTHTTTTNYYYHHDYYDYDYDYYYYYYCYCEPRLESGISWESAANMTTACQQTTTATHLYYCY